MHSSDRSQRRLSFEQLETKTAPSATLLGRASLGEEPADRSAPVLEQRVADADGRDSHWHCRHSRAALLSFVQDNTRALREEAWHLPSAEEANEADAMMMLGIPRIMELAGAADEELRI
jgi:hypothetical protein